MRCNVSNERRQLLRDEMLTHLSSDQTLDTPVIGAEAVRDSARDVVRTRLTASDRSAAVPERHGYQASQGSRVFGTSGTIFVFSVLIACGALALSQIDRPVRAPTRLTVATLPISSPETPQPKKAEKPRRIEKPLVNPAPKQPEQVRRPLLSLSPIETPAVVAVKPAIDPKPQPVQAAPPPSPPVPAPAPPQPRTNKGPDKWEGRILARLERFRHYPSDAQRSRQQGTAYIRFRVSRDGHVLSFSLDRSSGYPALDTAALETLRNADPLPKIPADRPDQVELVVPIEFSIAR